MKSKPKFNVIDALIILLVLAVACAGVYVIMNRRGNAADTVSANKTILYSVEFTACEESLAEAFNAAIGTNVWVSEKERALAELTDVKVSPARKMITNAETGEAVWAEVPELCDITVYLKSQGTETTNEVLADNSPIRVGDEVSVKGKGMAGYGFVTSLSLED